MLGNVCTLVTYGECFFHPFLPFSGCFLSLSLTLSLSLILLFFSLPPARLAEKHDYHLKDAVCRCSFEGVANVNIVLSFRLA